MFLRVFDESGLWKRVFPDPLPLTTSLKGGGRWSGVDGVAPQKGAWNQRPGRHRWWVCGHVSHLHVPQGTAIPPGISTNEGTQ